MSQKITVYTSSTSEFSQKLITFLTEKSANFVEKKIDQDAHAKEELANLTKGYLGTPITVFNTEVIIGFDQQRLEKLLS